MRIVVFGRFPTISLSVRLKVVLNQREQFSHFPMQRTTFLVWRHFFPSFVLQNFGGTFVLIIPMSKNMINTSSFQARENMILPSHQASWMAFMITTNPTFKRMANIIVTGIKYMKNSTNTIAVYFLVSDSFRGLFSILKYTKNQWDIEIMRLLFYGC